MEKHVICLDTSILIDYYRKKNKSKSFFFELAGQSDFFAVSSRTEYEIYIGSNIEQDKYWDDFFSKVISIPYSSVVNKQAIKIDRQLKAISKQIDTPDLMIAASAMVNGLKLATLNPKHFERIDGLEVIAKK